MFPYILGECQIGKCQALMDSIDSGWKKITSLHQATAKHLDDCIQTGNVPARW